jgi:hypothetical protein
MANDPELAVGSTVRIARPNFDQDSSEPAAVLDSWRVERRIGENPPSNWRLAVPPELFDRLRSRGVASAAPIQMVAEEAGSAPLPPTYRAPFLPEPVFAAEATVETMDWSAAPGLLGETIRVTLPPAFKGLDWLPAENTSMLLVSVRPVLDVALADKVVELLDKAPGMTAVRSLGSTEDIAAFEAIYNGPVTRMEAISQALRGIGAALVASGDREFYLAIQGQYVG